jgi:S-layer family protein
MTIIITKTKLALAILAVALLAPAAALATNVFADVPDGAFYAAPVEWAFNNNITTGKTATSFAPLDNVTRGESVTFLKRYDDNIVQPALSALPTTYWAWVTPAGALYTNTSSSGVSASSSSVGEYVVTFPVDVSGCSWSVAHRSVDGIFIFVDPDFEDDVFFDLSTRTTGFLPSVAHPTDIRVRVYEAGGALATSNFNLQVTCFPTAS